MRDLGDTDRDRGTAAGARESAERRALGLGAPSLEEVRVFRARLGLDAPESDDAARVDRLRALEELACATQAAQAETTADFTVSMRAAATSRGVRAERRDRGLGCQVGLARRESPHRGAQHLGLSMVLRTELPCTRAAFRAGRIDEFKAMLVARETACLTAEHRALVDEAVAGDGDRVEGYSIGELVGHLHRLAAQLDPAAVAERRRRAERDRHTSTRPAPDTMCWFRALLSVRDGVAVQATLLREAHRLRAAGDERGVGQICADLLVAWILAAALVTGTTTTTTTTTTTRTPTADADADDPVADDPVADDPTADDTTVSGTVPVMVNLVVSDTVLFGDGHGTGWVDGYGPVPGDLIREWIAQNLDAENLDGQNLDGQNLATQDRTHSRTRGPTAAATGAGGEVRAWLRRIYAQPATGRLVAMDSRAELFEGRLADFLRLRDQRCRTRWCDAPVRHLDHVVARAEGGPTTAENGQGLCEACNHAKQAHGWHARPRPGPRHTVETTTPTGHAYVSTAPAPPEGPETTRTGYRAGPDLAA